MGRQGRRRKQLPDELKEKRRHHNLKEEATERINKYVNKYFMKSETFLL
jgi:hypothetical protein